MVQIFVVARHTTNKGILPEVLVAEVRKAFTRSEEHLDQSDVDPMLEQKQQVQERIEQATPQQLDHILEVLASIGKTGQAS